MLPSGAFKIDKKLNAATLTATVSVTDTSGSTFAVDVDVSWTGTGAITTQKSHTQFKAPGFIESTRTSGSFREAAGSGTVSDATTNFTAQTDVEGGNLQSATSGTVTISHR